MPTELVKRFAFRIRFTLNNLLVFGQGDRALGFVMDLWPLPLGNDRPRNPVHVQRKVVDAAQVIRASRRPRSLRSANASPPRGLSSQGLTAFEFGCRRSKKLPIRAGTICIAASLVLSRYEVTAADSERLASIGR